MERRQTFDPLEDTALAAVRQALAKVGHDFGNLLTPLLAYPPMIMADLDDVQKARHLLEIIEKTTQDMVGVTRHMLDFSLCDDFDPARFDLNECVSMAVLELRKHMPLQIDLDAVKAEVESPVIGGRDQIQRAVEKLWRNAVDAVSDGGRVTIRTDTVRIDRDMELTTGRLPPGEYARLHVSDSGHGVPAETRRKVFEPFFTAHRGHGRRRGAGLGLTYVCVVARAHGGQVDMGTTQDGFTVSLYLRSAPEAVGAPPE